MLLELARLKVELSSFDDDGVQEQKRKIQLRRHDSQCGAEAWIQFRR